MTETNKEYAKALFMLAVEENMTAEYLKQLENLGVLIKENPQYLDLLASPALALSERLSNIGEAFEGRYDDYLVSFLKLLCENGRIRELPSCIDEFGDLVRQSENRVSVTVYSAVELSDSQKRALCEKLEKTYGNTVEATYVLDKSLLGGLKVQLDGVMLDGSLDKRLKKISTSL